MKDKRPIERQIEELSDEEKKLILRAGTRSLIITCLSLVAVLFCIYLVIVYYSTRPMSLWAFEIKNSIWLIVLIIGILMLGLTVANIIYTHKRVSFYSEKRYEYLKLQQKEEKKKKK